MSEDHKTIIENWINAWNTHDLGAAKEVLAHEYVRHDANLPDVVGSEAQLEFLAGIFSAFPELHFQTEQLIAENDLVVARLIVQGTHRGEFMGVAATGRQVKFQAVDIYRLGGNKIVEQWVIMDALGLLQQLGAIPGPG
jgi:steroid delta-isomerase-like uncharacterized protein